MSDVNIHKCINHKRQTTTSPAGFESATPENKRPQSHALDRAPTGVVVITYFETKLIKLRISNTMEFISTANVFIESTVRVSFC